MKGRPAEKSGAAIPRHVAIIMDGNGRWAKACGLPRIAGHREGVNSAREIVRACGELGVEVLTLYTFSAENWRRPLTEIEALMRLLVQTIGAEVENLKQNNVRLQTIGRTKDLPLPVRVALNRVMRETKQSTGLILNLALSYGGRQEIVDAARELAKSGKKRVTEESFAAHLYTAGLPDPDLLIRTSGELRISNFLLWQLAYAEIVVTDVLWPDFRKPQLLSAFEEFGRRHRRFGGVETA
jgi:undecaprenyl diphosphate synthase